MSIPHDAHPGPDQPAADKPTADDHTLEDIAAFTGLLNPEMVWQETKMLDEALPPAADPQD